MNLPRFALPALLFLLSDVGAGAAAADSDPLAQGFAAPPASAKAQVWWHWMSNNVSKEGITADLEDMKRAGIGGAIVSNIGYGGLPTGPVKFLSDPWWEMVGHAGKEAQRLGLDLGAFNCGGWSSSGGPWITPEFAMKKVVSSEQAVQGPASFSAALPLPKSAPEFYRDIAVMAFPTPPAEAVTMASLHPRITAGEGVQAQDAAKAFDGDAATAAALPLPKPGNPSYLQAEFDRPFAARTVVITPGTPIDGCGGEIQASDDGRSFHAVRAFSLSPGAPQSFGIPPVTARFYRIAFLQAGSHAPTIPVAEIDLSSRFTIERLAAKADMVRSDNNFSPDAAAPPAGDEAIGPDKIVDLTARLDASGKLAWDVPPGSWTIVRFGYTLTGAHNSPAPDGGKGLECDKLSKAGAEQAWSGLMAPMIQKAAAAGTTLKSATIDSYERGEQNWTAGFEKEFRRRRGYDLLPYLPVLTGRVVGSLDVSERFLHDFRATVAELWAENYYDQFAAMAHRSGLKMDVEPYGNGGFNDLRSGREADLVMGEFWARGGEGEFFSVKLASSIAHIYGKPLVGAEAFTALRGDWLATPMLLKKFGDQAFALGVNSFYLHSYTHQPWTDRAPGMTMGKYGTVLGRTNTWWADGGPEWLRYVARCQYLLQQGRYVADVLYFCGDEAPVGTGPMTPAPPPGYSFDACNDDVVLHRLEVKDGRLTLPDGMAYRVLVLPPQKTMTPALLAKVAALVKAGATVVGPKPLRSPSLSGYPECDQEVARLADALWDGGKIRDVASLDETLARLGVPPDFDGGAASPFVYLHRSVGEKEIYFVANQGDGFRQVPGRFRVSGKVPELWHPDTGLREKVALYTSKDGVTEVPLSLDPDGSVFVVFDKKEDGPHPVSLARDGGEAAAATAALEIRHASYEAVDGTGSADVTARVGAQVRDGALSIEARTAVLGGDPTPLHKKQLRVDYVADGREQERTVPEGARLEILPPAGNGLPDARLGYRDDGSLRLTAWRSGQYTVQAGTGKTASVSVPALPPPLALSGPWQVSFGSPGGPSAPLAFDKLISWSESPQSDVKYYSGTATYATTFQVPPGTCGANRRLFLDLGQVEVVASVRLNGNDLGVLWKKPYRVEITGAARDGENRLEVRVANLWPNRLIGDAQLPDDVEWTDGHLKQWPAWLLEGKPSPTGHVAFTTWRYWNKGDALLPSGLIGPVTIYPAADVAVP